MYSELACVCLQCSTGKTATCDKIPLTTIKPLNVNQEISSDEDEQSIDIDIEETIEVQVPQDDIFPGMLSPQDVEQAMNAENRLMPNVPYTVGQLESIITSFGEECDVSVELIGPNRWDILKKSTRSKEKKDLVNQISSSKETFAAVLNIEESPTSGHFLAVKLDLNKRKQIKFFY